MLFMMDSSISCLPLQRESTTSPFSRAYFSRSAIVALPLMMSAPKFVNAEVTQLMEPAKDKTWSYQTGRGAFMIGCDFKECAAEIQEFIYGK